MKCKVFVVLFRQKVIEELTGKCRSQEGKMDQLKGFEAERRKYEVRPVKVGPGSSFSVRSLLGQDRETVQANLPPGELGEGEQVGRRED